MTLQFDCLLICCSWEIHPKTFPVRVIHPFRSVMVFYWCDVFLQFTVTKTKQNLSSTTRQVIFPPSSNSWSCDFYSCFLSLWLIFLWKIFQINHGLFVVVSHSNRKKKLVKTLQSWGTENFRRSKTSRRRGNCTLSMHKAIHINSREERQQVFMIFLLQEIKWSFVFSTKPCLIKKNKKHRGEAMTITRNCIKMCCLFMSEVAIKTSKKKEWTFAHLMVELKHA